MVQVLGSSQHHRLVGGDGGGVAGVSFVGRVLVELPALVGVCLGHRFGKSQVGENPYVSVIKDTSFYRTQRRGGHRSWATAAVVVAALAQAPEDDP